jgi:MFS family permease
MYGFEFWIAYLANFLLTTSNSLTFRFADFVDFLGGSAVTTGLIWGIGTGVSVLLRVLLGWVVDLRGPRLVWLWSTVAFVASLLGFIPLDRLGPMIYLLRIAYTSAIAGMFSCSIVHISSRVAPHQRAELIGTLGTSGFIGMLAGPQLGDWIFARFRSGALPYEIMFGVAAGMGVLYFAVAAFLTRVPDPPAARHAVPLTGLLLRYWPGPLVAVAMMMGVGQVVPFTFLTRYAAVRGLGGIGTFFFFYAPTAFVLRVMGRQWPERFGRRNTAIFGLACVATSMLLYLPVRVEWQLMWAALFAGVGHALLFPSVTTLGAECFPERFRGTGTSLILGLVDMGTLFAAPAFGWIIDHWGFESMYLTACVTITLVCGTFAVTRGAREAADESPDPPIAGRVVCTVLPERPADCFAARTTDPISPDAAANPAVEQQV